MIQIDAVGILSIFAEGVCYGVSMVLYTIALVILLRRRGKAEVNKPMLVAIILMWTLGTLHICADLIRLMNAFLHERDDSRAYLTSISTTVYLIRSIAYVLQTLTGDGFILYRLYLVWCGDKRVCFPMFIVFLGNVAIGGGVLYSVALAAPGAAIFTAKRWVASFFGITLFSNFVCSGLLAWRVWSIHRRTAALTVGVMDRSLVTAAIIIVESGGLYSICLAIQLALYVSNTFAQYILSDMACQLVGIVFSLVIVRVGLGLSTDATGSNRNQSSFLPNFKATRGGTQGIDSFTMDPVEVHITKVVTQDDGSPTLPITFQDHGYDSMSSSKSDKKQSQLDVHLRHGPY